MKLNGLKKNNLRKKLGEVCVYCGCKNKLVLTIDHKIPLARGGADNEKNKQVCCFICNQFKGALTHEEFKKYNKALNILEGLNKLFFKMPQPQIIFKPHDFPMTEEHINNEIKKARELGWETQQED